MPRLLHPADSLWRGGAAMLCRRYGDAVCRLPDASHSRQSCGYTATGQKGPGSQKQRSANNAAPVVPNTIRVMQAIHQQPDRRSDGDRFGGKSRTDCRRGRVSVQRICPQELRGHYRGHRQGTASIGSRDSDTCLRHAGERDAASLAILQAIARKQRSAARSAHTSARRRRGPMHGVARSDGSARGRANRDRRSWIPRLSLRSGLR